MFELESFDIKLNTEIIGRNFIYAEELDSTNSLLLVKNKKQNIDGTVALAEKQVKGKGRKDRVWYSAKGLNLTFSVLFSNEDLISHNINLINFSAALAVAVSIENLYQLKTELKWPNDVLINKKKVAGILLESTSQGNKIERLVVGIGVNVNQTLFQGSFNIEPTSIKTETGQNIEREKFLAEILNNFEEFIDLIPEKSEIILKDWKSRCDMIGEKISITEGDATRYGIFEDIDENGFLLLKVKNKIEKIHFGDVSLG
ncbi:MAG: biotin--[acetyl-CoA-carboxylase] ligase [Ignavibacteriales bacterium]|nr:MAG: biotin--[acetyl-CoA-carboxylase] ligase [Ignavibacteriales bacterium]